MTRAALARWLAELDVTADDQAVLQLAIAEIVMNAVEHAYPADRPGEIGLDAVLRDEGYVECRVADHGAWREPTGADRSRGHGLMLAQHLVDEVVVSQPPQAASTPRGARGTMVTLKHGLRRPATLATRAVPGAPAALADRPFQLTAGMADSAALAVVAGPVDALTGEQFTRKLLAASCGGTLPLTVDMTEVSYLASAGVRALFQLRDQLTAQYQDLSLIAVPGSSVAFVLELVGLPYQGGETGRQ
jgi:anti-anti-sigma factor